MNSDFYLISYFLLVLLDILKKVQGKISKVIVNIGLKFIFLIIIKRKSSQQ